MSDKVANLLSAIKNSCMRRYTNVNVKRSKLNVNILEVLLKYEYIAGYKVQDNEICVELLYRKNFSLPNITELCRVSKPGKRYYSTVEKLKKTRMPFGIKVISTSQGVMSDSVAINKRLGGEVLCQVV